ncbi:MAG: carbohydrate porin [Chromatiales bacterium]|nr:carbohydrate porin [Chromatiales bacterium]
MSRSKFLGPDLLVVLALAVSLSPWSLFAQPAAAAITFDAVYTGEPISNLSGGAQTGGTYLDNLDLQINAEPGGIFGIPGLAGLLYVLYNNSNEFSAEYVGDAHIVSNIDAPRAWHIFEAWLDWAPRQDESVSLRAGLYDLNSEFDTHDTGGLFLNSAHGIGTDFSQSGLNGPSIFPVTSLALRVRTAWGAGGYGQFAILDGVPGDPDDPESSKIDLSDDDGALVVAELGWSGSDWRKLAVGAWVYTADFDPLTSPGGPQDDGNEGWYAIADRTVWRGDSATMAAFLRIGQAEERFNPFGGYLGFGTTLAGFSARRPDDELGVAVAIGLAGDEFKDSRRLDGLSTDSHETTIEFTYRAPITDWLTLQPDFQYVINPGTDPALDDAVVVSLRFELGWSRLLSGGR